MFMWGWLIVVTGSCRLASHAATEQATPMTPRDTHDDVGQAPREQYLSRRSLRQAAVVHQEALHARIAGLRFVLMLVAAWLAWAVFFAHAIAAPWLLAMLMLFVAVVVYHHDVARRRARAERAVQFYEAALARVEDRWRDLPAAARGTGGERFVRERLNVPHHVYAADLDLFGPDSLFELLCGARTRMGEDTLASWLLAPATAAAICERQISIEELRDRLDLREDVAVLGARPGVGVQPDALLSWAETANTLLPAGKHGRNRVLTVIAIGLPLLAVAGFAVWQLIGVVAPLLLVLAAEVVVLRIYLRRIAAVLRGTEAAFEDLRLFSGVLLRMEAEQVSSQPLRTLLQRLASRSTAEANGSGRSPASTTIAQLSSVVGFMEARRNPLLAVLEIPLLYSLHTALAAERWRRDHGASVREWIAVVGEFEALLSLSAYRFEHPEDPLPEIVEGPACFAATAIGHPLIPRSQCVRNDVQLGGALRVLLVSGSNMSGKSTLLRTVGINAVLAMAGAPVRAQRLRISPLQVGASIRVNDSLHEGSSRFYAEITRLRQLLELTGRDVPLLFLLDELLQGTNSNDRRIGAEGVVRAFVDKHAIGLVSTHDLALTEIRGLADGSLRNVHLQDEIEDGRMKFDFVLRDGVVTRSNGIALMRSVGLDV